MKVLRKLTLKTIGWERATIQKALPETDGESVKLARIAGETVEARTGQTERGEFVKLLGDFVAHNLVTGEQYQAASCILPSFLSESLAAALRNSPAVGFAVEVSARADKTAITGYVFEVASLMPAEPSPKLQRLLGYAGIRSE